MEEEEEEVEMVGGELAIKESIKMVVPGLGGAWPVPNCVISLSQDLAISQLDLHSVTLGLTLVNTSKLTQPVWSLPAWIQRSEITNKQYNNSH